MWKNSPNVASAARVLVLAVILAGFGWLSAYGTRPPRETPVSRQTWRDALSGPGLAGVDRLLAECPALDVNAPTPEGPTPLALAAEAGRLDAVDRLLGRGADPNVRGLGSPPFVAAAAGGHDHVVRRLLDAGGRPTRFERWFLDAGAGI